MVKTLDSILDVQIDGQHDESSAQKAKKPRKKGSGRLKGSTRAMTAAKRKDPTGELAQAEKVATRQRRIINRQRRDCEALAKVISANTPGTKDARDVGALARATNILHELERKAHDFGDKGAQVRAVIVIPAGPATMEAWEQMSVKALGDRAMLPAAGERVRVVEDDVLGEAPPEPEEEPDHD